MGYLEQQLNDYLDNEDNDYECAMCSKPIDYAGYCSNSCRMADER